MEQKIGTLTSILPVKGEEVSELTAGDKSIKRPLIVTGLAARVSVLLLTPKECRIRVSSFEPLPSPPAT